MLLFTHFLHNIFAVVECEWKRNYKSLNLQKKIKLNFREIFYISPHCFINVYTTNFLKCNKDRI